MPIELNSSQLQPSSTIQTPDTPGRVLIAVNSCWRDMENGSNQAIRRTWGKQLPENYDLRFFIGGRDFNSEELKLVDDPDWISSPATLGPIAQTKKVKIYSVPLQEDEVVLDCSDSYLGLPWKTQESIKWALERNYSFIFRAFVDTYLFVDRLAKSDLTNFPYVGQSFDCLACPAHPDSKHVCPLGGAGYLLNAECASLLAQAPVSHWGEDSLCGFVMSENGIILRNDRRLFYDTYRPPELNKSRLTIHLNDRSHAWNPQLMLDTHKVQEAAKSKYLGWDGLCPKCQETDFEWSVRGPVCVHCGARVNR